MCVFCENGKQSSSELVLLQFPISACQFDAPIVLSWPHFLGANSSFSRALDGIEPARKDLHGFWFDVQPTTGTTLSAKARLQVNIAIKSTTTFEALDKVTIA